MPIMPYYYPVLKNLNEATFLLHFYNPTGSFFFLLQFKLIDSRVGGKKPLEFGILSNY